MAKGKGKEWDFVERMRLLQRAGIAGNRPADFARVADAELLPFETRLDNLLGLLRGCSAKPEAMVFFVLYDIEDNKVRRYLAKYLEQKGCVRVQRSVFMAELDRVVYREIATTVAEVNELYDNHDSILLIPIAADQLNAMRVIGKALDIDMILGRGNTLFF